MSINTSQRFQSLWSKLPQILRYIICAKLLVPIIMLGIVTNVEAWQSPIQLPYTVSGADGAEELKSIIAAKQDQYLLTLQEIDLGMALSIIGVFQPMGFGIITIDTYVYTCERTSCTLFVFLSSYASDVILELNEKTQELILKSNNELLKSHNLNILFKTPFPWIKRLPKKKDKPSK